MKNSVSLLFILGQLAAAGHTLDTRADADVECFELDKAKDQKLTFNAHSVCSDECADEGHTVFAVQGQSCICLDSLPSDDKKVDAAECNVSCPGYGPQTCGGRPAYGGRPGYYSVGIIDAAYFEPSNTTNTTATSTGAASSTVSSTSISTSSSVPSNSTSSVTPPSGSASGSSASATQTIDSSSAAAPTFGTSFTVVSSFLYAVAAFVALV